MMPSAAHPRVTCFRLILTFLRHCVSDPGQQLGHLRRCNCWPLDSIALSRFATRLKPDAEELFGAEGEGGA